MGCFDTVNVPCHYCRVVKPIQVKSGPCTGAVYELSSAPASVLHDLDDGHVLCHACTRTYKIMLRAVAVTEAE